MSTTTFRQARKWPLIAAGALSLLAGVQRWWIAPHWLQLPDDYAAETRYATTGRIRESRRGPWTPVELVARRVDQVISAPGPVAIVQGDMHWTTKTGRVVYETSGLYGVHRYTRRNVPHYGNVSRSGLFLFPLHTQRTTYQLWDPFYGGPRTATYQRSEVVGGVEVDVFTFTARGVDDTTGYSHLPDVPERYDVRSDGDGTLWVEPVSGVVVDFKDAGVSYFVSRPARRRLEALYEYRDHYTPQPKAAHLQLATAARQRVLVLESWLPAGLLLAGVGLLIYGVTCPTRSAGDGASQQATPDSSTVSGGVR